MRFMSKKIVIWPTVPWLKCEKVDPRVGYLVYLADGMYTPSQGVSFSPLFSNAGYQKKAIPLKPVIKRVISLLSCEFFYVLDGTFLSPICSKAGCYFEGKSLRPAEKLLLGVHTLVQLRVKYPPPPLLPPGVSLTQ